jgi:hypothetical protein
LLVAETFAKRILEFRDKPIPAWIE